MFIQPKPLQIHSKTSHAQVAFVPVLASPVLRYPNTIRCQYSTISSRILLFLLFLSSSISANPFATQLGNPISFTQNLPSTLPVTFYNSSIPHTSIQYLILDSRTISKIFSSVYIIILGVTDKTHILVG